MGLAKRNLKIFFRDKGAVFFSFLSSLIVIGLYFLFLGRAYTSEFKNLEHIKEFMDNWIFSGVLGITTVTTSISTLGIMVTDKQYKIYKDFYVTPIKRSQFSRGYLFSGFMITMILSLFTLLVAEIFIVVSGGSLLSATAFLKVLGIIALTAFANTSMIFWLVSFFRTSNALSVASTIIGTLIGFLTGIYLPIGNLPESVQWVVKLFPPAHGVLLFREAMTKDIIKKCFAGVPVQAVDEVKKIFGIVFEFGEHKLPLWMSAVFLLITGIFFFVLSSFRIRGSDEK